MIFSKVVDTRLENARWVATQFALARQSGLNERDAARAVLQTRYARASLAEDDASFLADRLERIQTVFDAAHAIAELENLRHLSAVDRHTLMVGDKSIQQDVFDTMDAELRRLGVNVLPRRPMSPAKVLAIGAGVGLVLFLSAAYVISRLLVATPLIALPNKNQEPAAPVAAASQLVAPEASQPAPDLVRWHAELQQKWAAVDQNDPTARANFDKEAAEYHAALRRVREATAASPTSAASLSQ